MLATPSRLGRLHQYEEIANLLRLQIRRGDFRHSGRLPSERVLGQRFQVQRNTVRQALALLESEGIIRTEAKRGAFVQQAGLSIRRNVFLMHMHSGPAAALSQLMEGFSSVVEKAGFVVRCVNTHPAEGTAIDPVPVVEQLPPDTAGVVLWPQNPTDAEALFRLNSVVPLVLVDRRVYGVSADCVRFDDVEGGRLVAEHLIGLGHRKIMFLTDDVFAETVQNRWRGYVVALEAAGIPVDPRLALFFNGLHDPSFSVALRSLLAIEEVCPTAILCSNDLVAFSLLRFLHEANISMVVTGYGNMMPDYLHAMALTSVDQPFIEMGRKAAEILLERVGQSSEERMRDPRDVSIPTQLVVRPAKLSLGVDRS